MSEHYHDPVHRGFIGGTIHTAAEATKGAVSGLPTGIGKGILAAAGAGLVAGLVVTGGWMLAAAPIAALTSVTMAGALPFAATLGAFAGALTTVYGVTTGAVVGGVLGPLAGMFKGLRQGHADVVHQRGTAQTLEVMNNAAMAQAETARVLQAKAIQDAMTPAQPQVVHVPVPVQAPHHEQPHGQSPMVTLDGQQHAMQHEGMLHGHGAHQQKPHAAANTNTASAVDKYIAHQQQGGQSHAQRVEQQQAAAPAAGQQV